MSSTRLITNSDFIRGYDCSMRLRHAIDHVPSIRDRDEYARLLEEGGLQFEKLVRASWPGELIHEAQRDPAAAAEATIDRVRSSRGNVGVLHKAVFVHGDFMARADMLRVEGDRLLLCEIEAKAVDGPSGGHSRGESVTDLATEMLASRSGGVVAKWRRSLANVAFQTVVVERALAAAGLGDLKVVPRLVVANRSAVAGEFDHFGNIRLRAESVGKDHLSDEDFEFVNPPPAGYLSPLVLEVDVSEGVRRLREVSSQSEAEGWRELTVEALMESMAAILRGSEASPERERGWKCRDCEFRSSVDRDGRSVESGLDRCWGDLAPVADSLLKLYRGRGYRPAGVGTLGEGGQSDTGPSDNGLLRLVVDRITSSAASATGSDRWDGAVHLDSLTPTDAAQIWERARRDPRGSARPRFDWSALAEIAPDLATEGLNPLCLRMLLEAFRDQAKPTDLAPDQLFEAFLNRPRELSNDVPALLTVLAEDMLARRSARFSIRELEHAGHGQLLWQRTDSSWSALEHLVRHDILTRISDGQAFVDVYVDYTFTMDRVAEQVLGEHLAVTAEAATGPSLARLSDELVRASFNLGPGAVRVALRRRSTRDRSFLIGFIDAGPEQVGSLAGDVVARLLMAELAIAPDRRRPERRSLLDSMLAEPTLHDLSVMDAALEWLGIRIDALSERPRERAAARALLEGLVRTLGTSQAIATQASVVMARHIHRFDAVDEPLERLRSAAKGGPAVATSTLCVALRNVVTHAPDRLDLLEECIRLRRLALDADPSFEHRIDLARDLLCRADLLVPSTPRGSSDRGGVDDSIAAYGEAASILTSSESDEATHGELLRRSLQGLAAALRSAGRLDEAADVGRRGFLLAHDPSMKLGFAYAVADALLESTSSLSSTDAHSEVIEWLSRAVELARGLGSRDQLIASLVRLGQAELGTNPTAAVQPLSEAARLAEQPPRIAGFPIHPIVLDLAKALDASGRTPEAVEQYRRAYKLAEEAGESANLLCQIALKVAAALDAYGRTHEAIEQYRLAKTLTERALMLASDNTQLTRLLSRLETLIASRAG